jgi:hypothetical protein
VLWLKMSVEESRSCRTNKRIKNYLIWTSRGRVVQSKGLLIKKTALCIFFLFQNPLGNYGTINTEGRVFSGKGGSGGHWPCSTGMQRCMGAATQRRGKWHPRVKAGKRVACSVECRCSRGESGIEDQRRRVSDDGQYRETQNE